MQRQDGLLSIRHAAGRGRGLFTVQDLAPKTRILLVPQPPAATIQTEDLSLTCYSCYKPQKDPLNAFQEEIESRLKICGGCKVVKFCDQVQEQSITHVFVQEASVC
jgi:hypothetical protein